MIKLKDLLFEQETKEPAVDTKFDPDTYKTDDFDPAAWFTYGPLDPKKNTTTYRYRIRKDKKGKLKYTYRIGQNGKETKMGGGEGLVQQWIKNKKATNLIKPFINKTAIDAQIQKNNGKDQKLDQQPYKDNTQPDLTLTTKDENQPYNPGFREGTLEKKWYDALLQQELSSENAQYDNIDEIPDDVKKKIAKSAQKFAEKQREKAFDQKYKTVTIDTSIPKDELMSSGVDFNKALFRVSAVKNPKVQVINYTEGDDGRDYYLVKFINKRFLGPNYGYVLAADFKYDSATKTAEYQGDKDNNQDKYRVFKSNV